ncbi:UDP-glucosyltransferase 2-like [Periplaneta americana]|uniref:UDP-glucosyltransferase 2-like n=1 Tax=Periplaneta americana TaxID=6978 RepID=UPI0037E93B92
MRKIIYVLQIISFVASTALGARILGVFPLPSKSHQMIYRSLMRGLQLRGHEIVTITTDPVWDMNVKNYTEIDMSISVEYWEKRYIFAAQEKRNMKIFNLLSDMAEISTDLCRIMFQKPEVQKLLQGENHFDVIIIEWLGCVCSNAYAYHFSAPLIGISPFALIHGGHDSVANPTNPTYITDINIPISDRATFWERLVRFLYSLLFRYIWFMIMMPAHDKIAKEYFGRDLPYVGDLQKNVSLLLVNYESKIAYTQPNVPAVVEIGGIHLREPQPLDTDLQNFLDGAPEGVIYFNFGTNINSGNLAPDVRQMFLDVFSDLPQFRVLWKWDTDELPGQPSNVKLAKWFPQQDLLHHPSIKVFIYHGGLQSTLEAIKASVPLIGIPFFGDQFLNVRNIAEKGAGVVLDLDMLTKHSIKQAITEIIYNPIYKENMRKMSTRLSDQPNSPLDRAVWWVEYVIRHRGARHLRSAAVDLTWYQYLLLDVIAFIITVFIFTIWVAYRSIRLMKKIQLSLHNKKIKIT